MVSERIGLSPEINTNLFALQKTTDQLNAVTERLATGLKVPDATVDAAAFFQSQTLSSRAAQLQTVKDGIDTAISTTDAALEGITGIQALVEQLRGLAFSTLSDTNTTNRSKAAVQFNDLRAQIDNMANDATFNSTNLIKGSPGSLTVTFSEDGSSTFTIAGIKSDASGLSITTAAGNWATDANINAAVNDLDSALNTLRSTATTIGTSASFLTTRLDFTTNLINTLEEGAGKLVNADLNEESANLLILQTRQQLGTIGLSIAASSAQAVFTLF